MSCRFKICFLAFLLFIVSMANEAFADFVLNSESSREAIINSSRTKKFYNKDQTVKRMAFGVNLDSDQNSKQNQITARYFYQSSHFIHELNFLHESEYNDVTSGKTKSGKVKTSDFYDLSLSSKIRLYESRNYLALYHRTAYDKLSTYYYDHHSAVGLGRMFFNDKLELDLSVGYQNTKTYNSNIDLIPSIRVNFLLTKKLTFNQRGYWFINENSTDSDLRTSLIYRLSNKVSFEVRHTFEKRRYVASPTSPATLTTNQVRNLFTVGLVFDL